MTAAARMFSSSVATAVVLKLLEIHSPTVVAIVLLSSSARVVMVSVVRGRGRQRGLRLGAVGSSFNSPATSISPSRRRKHRRHHSGSLSSSFARLKHRVGVLGCKGFGRVANSTQPPPPITGYLWPLLSPSPTAISSSLSIARVRVLGCLLYTSPSPRD